MKTSLVIAVLTIAIAVPVYFFEGSGVSQPTTLAGSRMPFLHGLPTINHPPAELGSLNARSVINTTLKRPLKESGARGF